MAGKKGRSGRRARSETEIRLAVIDKAWEISMDILEDENVKLEEKLKVAVPIVVKDIKTKVEGTLEVNYVQEALNLRRLYQLN